MLSGVLLTNLSKMLIVKLGFELVNSLTAKIGMPFTSLKTAELFKGIEVLKDSVSVMQGSCTLIVMTGDFQVNPPVNVVSTLKVTVTCVVMPGSKSMTVFEPD